MIFTVPSTKYDRDMTEKYIRLDEILVEQTESKQTKDKFFQKTQNYILENNMKRMLNSMNDEKNNNNLNNE